MSSLSIAHQLGTLQLEESEVLDMICIGFGPASLAIAIALADKCAALSPSSRPLPRVLFLEKQPQFSWHAGMQLPEAHMQISFLKDLATPRDPTSPFSFINYLHSKGRLQKFINLGTFLPARKEYEDYMRWCAEHFDNSVRYGREITKVDQVLNDNTGLVDGFKVQWNDIATGDTGMAHARHVVVATGGSPFVPEIFKPFTTGSWPRFQHSSKYATAMQSLEKVRSEPEAVRHELEAALDSLDEATYDVLDSDSLASQMIAEMGQDSKALSKPQPTPRSADEIAAIEKKAVSLRQKLTSLRTGLDAVGLGEVPERFVVIGGGQSAAEIYVDLQSRFPKSEVVIVVKGASLRPSDDSPFVNEIFDPDRVDGIFAQDPAERQAALTLDKATNYGVVRLELLERIYEALYHQEITEPDSSKWRCRVLPNRSVLGVARAEDGRGVVLDLAPTSEVENGRAATAQRECLAATMVFFATGYVRNAHERILAGTRDLLPQGCESFKVARDYRVNYDEAKVDGNAAGVWLQGCNEKTHGVSTPSPWL